MTDSRPAPQPDPKCVDCRESASGVCTMHNGSDPAPQPEHREALRERAAFLADLAARAVTEPRLFHEDAGRQHDLGVALADVRRVLGTPDSPREGHEPCDAKCACYWRGWEDGYEDGRP
jgi:hypothetical protein